MDPSTWTKSNSMAFVDRFHFPKDTVKMLPEMGNFAVAASLDCPIVAIIFSKKGRVGAINTSTVDNGNEIYSAMSRRACSLTLFATTVCVASRNSAICHTTWHGRTPSLSSTKTNTKPNNHCGCSIKAFAEFATLVAH
jgi:hypothetical protein